MDYRYAHVNPGFALLLSYNLQEAYVEIGIWLSHGCRRPVIYLSMRAGGRYIGINKVDCRYLWINLGMVGSGIRAYLKAQSKSSLSRF